VKNQHLTEEKKKAIAELTRALGSIREVMKVVPGWLKQ
jgi:hypothetical protein